MSKLFVPTILNYLLLSFAATTETEKAKGIQNDEASGSSQNQTNSPIILLVKNAETSLLRPTVKITNPSLPPTTTRILKDDSISYKRQQNEKKLYLCPYPNLRDKIFTYFEDVRNIEKCLYETKFQRQPKRCEHRPEVVIEHRLITTMRSCNSDPNKILVLVGLLFCSPIIGTSKGEKCYREGILEFIQQESPVRIIKKILDMFELCYNTTEKIIEWTLQTVKPSWDLQTVNACLQPQSEYLHFDDVNLPGNRFEKMYRAFNAQDNTSPYSMKPYRMVPKGERSFDLWKTTTSHLMNVAPLWVSLVPLMKLIDDRIQRLSNHLRRNVKVMTKTLYYELNRDPGKMYLNNEEDLLIPNIWSKHVYDLATQSAIVIVVHNTPGVVPVSGELCVSEIRCEFQNWRHISTAFGDCITDEMIRYAYCCTKAKFSTNQDVYTRSIIDMNFQVDLNSEGDSSAIVDGRKN